MNVLRLLVDAPIAPDAPLPWSLHDASGTCVRSGVDAADDWPHADRVEIVIAASQVRLASVALPPLPPARVAAAAAFALEDQVANPADAPVLVASRQRADGRVVVAIVARPLLAGLRSAHGMLGRVDRAIAEPELADPGTAWCWCAPDDVDSEHASPHGMALGSVPQSRDGFVRVADGSAFPVGAQATDGSLPPEIALALAAAARSNTTPSHIRVDGNVGDEMLARWQHETSVPFVRDVAWRWDAQPAAAYAAATNLLQGEFAIRPAPRSGDRMRSFKPAIWIAASALALHIAATVGEWAWWRVDSWRALREMRALAVASGASDVEAATFEGARTAIARRYAERRHANRLAAPNDALPLLARAAPALGGVPPGTVKSATYADGHWTFDLQRADPFIVREIDARLKRYGMAPILATTQAGTRVRLGSE